MGGNDNNWDRYLNVVRHSINTTVSDTTGMSPVEALFSYPVRGAFDLLPILSH